MYTQARQLKELVFLWYARTPHMCTDILPSPSTASSSTSILTQPWAHCRAASRSLHGRAMPGAPLSSATALFLSSSGHPMSAHQLGVHSPVLPLGPIHCSASSGPSTEDMVSHHDQLRGSHSSKTNRASNCPIMVLLISSSCCLLGPWRWVPLPAAG